jgi:Ca-activated chloride channel family protein
MRQRGTFGVAARVGAPWLVLALASCVSAGDAPGGDLARDKSMAAPAEAPADMPAGSPAGGAVGKTGGTASSVDGLVGSSGPMAAPPSPAKSPAAGERGIELFEAEATASAAGPKEKMRLRKDGEGDDSTGAEAYADPGVNPWVEVGKDPLSTFAIDVDSASYTIARRKILEGNLPPAAAVRPEEFINYFKYDYAPPAAGAPAPFAVHLEAAPSPFARDKVFLRVGLKGKELSKAERKPAHLTFLVDVSGSMDSPDKIGLLKRSLRILVDNLQDGDSVALVTYASDSRVVLPPTGMEKKAIIHAAIEDLTAGGSTAMGSGLAMAYREAAKTLGSKSLSRVIVCSDGDANVGTTSHEEILKTIAGHVSEGITLSTVGFGMGNYKDAMMERLADKGNGNAYYIDGISEARRIFQEQLGGTLEVIAKDVKVQVEFEAKAVRRYRLIGYENRDIADRDFRDDKVDAGELGAGHRVTAVYELELTGERGGKLGTVRLRHKEPRGVEAKETAYAIERGSLKGSFEAGSVDFRFAVAVAAFADILRRSPHAESWSLKAVAKLAKAAAPEGNAERAEFLGLLDRAMSMALPGRKG